MEPEDFGCPDGKYLLIVSRPNGMGRSADGGRAAGMHSGTDRKDGKPVGVVLPNRRTNRAFLSIFPLF